MSFDFSIFNRGHGHITTGSFMGRLCVSFACGSLVFPRVWPWPRLAGVREEGLGEGRGASQLFLGPSPFSQRP